MSYGELTLGLLLEADHLGKALKHRKKSTGWN
jgi:hypothetical protein